MARTLSSFDIEDLAADIGKQVYMDIAKWHLYLAEAHLHTPLAKKLATLIEADTLSDDQVASILAGIPVQIGDGKQEIPLIQLIPMKAQVALMDILEEYQRG
jgi:hypothetical protein